MAVNPLVSLNLLVDKSNGRVIFAESNSHFVDILLSFLTLPLSSILRLTANSTSLGSVYNLFASVENLSGDCFSSESSRAMLLQPVNSAANLLTSLPIDYDSHRLNFSYLCNDRSCYDTELSFYANARCTCGKMMDRREQFVADDQQVSSTAGHQSGVFLEDSFRLTISDDLHVFQSSAEVSVDLLAKLDIKRESSSFESVNVDVTVEKIHELLKRMLVSETPLTDVFLGGCHGSGHRDGDKVQINEECSEAVAVKSTSSRKISTKLYLNKDENKVLFAEADKDFAEFLASFLTFPMGSVVNKLGGKSGIRCVDNLYNSIEGLKTANCFKKAHGLVQMLLNPKLPPYFSLKDNGLMKIDEQRESGTRYYTCRTDWCDSNAVRTVPNVMCKACKKISIFKRLTLTDPKCGGEYMRSSQYMVTDDLVVKQLSSVMITAGILQGAGGGGIIARSVEIGEEEALLLLQASVTSKNVLTDALLGKNKRRPRSNYI